MTTKLVTDKGENPFDMSEQSNRLFPTLYLQHCQDALNFKARPDDIIVSGYHSSGTHWTFEMIHFLLAGTTDIPREPKEDTVLGKTAISSIDNLPTPRNISTLHHFEYLAPDIFRQKCKVVYLIRDPRDLAVSYFHHVKKKHNYQGTWNDFFQLFLEGKAFHGSWFKYIKGWEKGIKENPDHPFLVIIYESLKEDPLKEARTLAEFLGVNCSEYLLRDVVAKTSFECMKRNRPHREQHIYRKGIVGDWKNYFTKAQSDLFNQVFEKEMTGTVAYTFYSHSLQSTSDANMETG